ncbi:hypothetical protein GQX73_g10461 [Xylaria multiplex]|uniref:HNH nuclease domain-containing protein n=1 Tax=Xylaria multiplex TaxID=323545 RepID=A0A7C8MKU1_9PEZI|nr:hypothetical protein GQX73_g10461 [Xylaria multiplex]
MASSLPPHHHQSSLEGVIDFLAEAPLEIHQRNNARRRFYRIVEHFGAAGGAIDSVPLQYEPPRLVRFKASINKTPQPSPTFHSAAEGAVGGAQGFTEAASRMRKDGNNARDDDGTLLGEDLNPFDALEVAHILPHSLMKADAGYELNSSKQAALAVLNMFDNGVVHLINGTDIDLPRNAITLTSFLHLLFGNFQVFFESAQDLQPHTYQIHSFHPRHLLRDPALPITRTLYLTNDRSIDPPSPRLLAVHRAIAHILHFSAAGEYIDKLLRDMDEEERSGQKDLGRILRIAANSGPHDGPIAGYLILGSYFTLPGIRDGDPIPANPIIDPQDPDYDAKLDSWETYSRKWWQLLPPNPCSK